MLHRENICILYREKSKNKEKHDWCFEEEELHMKVCLSLRDFRLFEGRRNEIHENTKIEHDGQRWYS